jgi:DnaK suppressor protein
MKETVSKTSKKPGATAARSAQKPGVVKAVASALARKIADALAPAAKKTAAAKPKPASRPAKSAPKPAGKPAAKTAVKPAVKAAKAAPVKAAAPGKTAARKAATKAVAPKAVVKPAAKAAKPVALRAKAPAKPAAKTVAAPVKKATPASTRKAPAKPAATAVPPAQEASTKMAAQHAAVKASDTEARTTGVGGAIAELADKMKTSVVSKVSEVMTKTSKSTPAVNDGRVLSEDEIRSMTEKDYMNPAQLAFFKARLQQLEKDLLKNAGETTEHLRETVLVPDPADRATIEEEHALELRTRDRERKLLKKVQQSIAAIDAGDYGWCEETGEPIGIPRLIARPTATLSLEAQQRRELKQKLYGD